MKYNFDQIINRSNTSSIKHDLKEMIFGTPNILPLWVADMDFETPQFVRNAIMDRALHPVYGYTFRDDAYYESIINWMQRRHRWHIEKDWILFSPGVVPGLNMAVMAFTDPGDAILVQPPVYFPFFSAVKDHDRVLLENELVCNGSSYEIDFDDFEEKAKQAKLFILCSPHNPLGRSWTCDELQKMADICLKHNVLVLSDEIHNDLVLPPFKHQVFADLSPKVADITITMHAPSKTFNLAGLATSSVIISNEILRKKMKGVLSRVHIEMGNIFGIEATKAAFNAGDEWLDQLLVYLKNNIHMVAGLLHRELPALKVFVPEATYMIWMDFNFTQLSDEALHEMVFKKAGVGLNKGSDFGPGGSGMMRMNIASPLETVMLGARQLVQTFKSL